MRRFVSKDSKRDFYYIIYAGFWGYCGVYLLSVCGEWEVFGVES